MEIRLNDRVVLVTGGSSGIGEAICRCLAEAGATVALHFRSRREHAEELVASFGRESEAFQADFSEPRNATALFDRVIERYGVVDVLVNNAGIFVDSPVERESDLWLDDWNRTLAVNLTAAGMLCRSAINHFRERSGGRIIHIASRAAFRGETEEYLAYAASKGGLVSLSRSIARSFGHHNITSFVIAPGFVRTPMTADYLARNEKRIIEGELALRELTSPTDIAPLVAFISGGMMDHATGCTIDINAGSYMR
ncbi:MAG: SDR family NAD(P)-dependent oxidoreductase [bacterium]|nr:MAG: SDR family NAD(P)-dependent oxidoreductase [bacterium]